MIRACLNFIQNRFLPSLYFSTPLGMAVWAVISSEVGKGALAL